MESDDARNHTRKIFERMRLQSNSQVGRGPIKAFPLKLDQEEEERESDDTLVDAESDKMVIEREVPSEGPLLLKEVATNTKTTKLTTRLTYGISERESDDTLVDAESDKMVIEREVPSEGPLLLKERPQTLKPLN